MGRDRDHGNSRDRDRDYSNNRERDRGDRSHHNRRDDRNPRENNRDRHDDRRNPSSSNYQQRSHQGSSYQNSYQNSSHQSGRGQGGSYIGGNSYNDYSLLTPPGVPMMPPGVSMMPQMGMGPPGTGHSYGMDPQQMAYQLQQQIMMSQLQTQQAHAGGYNHVPWGMQNQMGRQGNYQDSRSRGMRDERDRRDQYRDPEEHHRQMEEHRLRVTRECPGATFVEEVNLPPEYAFCIDTKPDHSLLNLKTLPNNQKPAFYKDYFEQCALGASPDELALLAKIYKRPMHLPPPAIDEDGNPTDPSIRAEDNLRKRRREEESGKTQEKEKDVISLEGATNPKRPFAEFIGFDKGLKNPKVFDQTKRRDDGSMRDKVESYNSRLAKDPKNVALWKEFVIFQDEYFKESNRQEEEMINQAKRSKRDGKIKGNKKRLIEKKIAILEKALEANQNNVELNLDRMFFMNEINKPENVLTSWRDLVNCNQQIATFWDQYLLYTATQLGVFKSSTATAGFLKCFKKFRMMLNDNFPEFQRPKKFHLLASDLFLGFTLVLKNAGFIEKATAIHQGQLEMDFYFPENMKENNQNEIENAFDKFWDEGSARFGEPNSPGWCNLMSVENYTTLTLGETGISDFEFKYFQSCIENKEIIGPDGKLKHWLAIESFRSKMQWLPWRANCSDKDEIDDSQRMVLSIEVTPFLIRYPEESKIFSENEKNAISFRHVLNFILVLQEDFLTRTHTLEFIISSFSSISISEIRSLFTEIHYWKTFNHFYHTGEVKLNSIIPPGFKLNDLLSYSSSDGSLDDETFFPKYEPLMNQETTQIAKFVKENSNKRIEMIRNILVRSLDHLSPQFASLLTRIYLRFEQKNTFGNIEDVRKTIKFSKNLLKHDKLKNSSELFGEIALLEHFAGKRVKATVLLTKTVNLGGNFLSAIDISVSNDWLATNWAIVADITRLYRILAEFHLKDDMKKAAKVLTALGNNFQSVNLEGDEKPKSTEILKARRVFEKLFNELLSLDFSIKHTNKFDNELTLHTFGGELCVETLVQIPNLLVEWTTAYALFQYLTVDYTSANEVFAKVISTIKIEDELTRITKYDAEIVNIKNIREQVYLAWCKFGAYITTVNKTENALFRNTLHAALLEFPSSPPLLLLFVDIENQFTIIGKLWRLMMNYIKQEGKRTSMICNFWGPTLMALGLARKIEEMDQEGDLALEQFGLGGPSVTLDTFFYKLDSLLTAAEENPLIRHSPLIWRIHLKLMALRVKETKDNKDKKKAFSIYYDAIRNCPSVKLIYMDIIAYFPEKFKEIYDVISEKQILIRLPIQELELLLEEEDEKLEVFSIASMSDGEVE